MNRTQNLIISGASTNFIQTCDFDMSGSNKPESLVTDFIQELSSGLQIPFLLGQSTVHLKDEVEPSVTVKNEVDSIDFAYYEAPNEYTSRDGSIFSNYNFSNHSNELKETSSSWNESGELPADLQDFLMSDALGSTGDSSGSGNGSGSECSSSDLWIIKNDLDTPPITPPDEQSSENIVIYSTSDLQYIPQTVHTSRKKSASKNLHNIISRKVRIQPKPEVSFSVIDTQTQDNIPNNRLVSDDQITIDCLNIINANSDTNKSSISWQDRERVQAKRKQERMIRNRASACESRKKKKEYVVQLEKQVQNLTTENNQLKLENYRLRERLTKYEDLGPFNVGKSRNFFVDSPRKTTALFALMLTVCLNIGSFSNLMPDRRGDTLSDENLVAFPSPAAKHSRSLLWTNVDTIVDGIETTLSNVTKPRCPMSINQTESIRLESELRRWIGEEDFPKKDKRNGSPKIHQYFDSSNKSTKQKSAPRKKNRFRKLQPLPEVNLFGVKPHVVLFDNLFEAIHRRDDTFYLVSFSADHLLLPALAHNKTSRPKMSLMLPAFLSNSTLAGGSDLVEMMQIDCEVTNTQLLSVKEDDIPFHMRQQAKYANATTREKDVVPDLPFDEYVMDQLRLNVISNRSSRRRLRRSFFSLYGNTDEHNTSGSHFRMFLRPGTENRSYELSKAEVDSQTLYEEKDASNLFSNLTNLPQNGSFLPKNNVHLLEANYLKGKSMLKSLIFPRGKEEARRSFLKTLQNATKLMPTSKYNSYMLEKVAAMKEKR